MASPVIPSSNPNPERSVSVAEIVNGTRCSPLTLKEFEEFLIHSEHSVENLLFTVWYRSYSERFAALPSEYQALSYVPDRYRPQMGSRASSMRTASIKGAEPGFWGKLVSRKSSTDVEKGSGGDWEDNGDALNGFEMASSKLGELESSEQQKESDVGNGGKKEVFKSESPVIGLKRTGTDLSALSATDSENLDKKSKRFPNLRFANLAPLLSKSSREKTLPEDTPLPFIDEISLILTTFILPGSSRELNLDDRMRKHILRSLQPIDENGNKLPPATTHPDVFFDAQEHAFDLMERSLPKYLSYAKGNTNAPKTLFWYAIGILDFGIGVMLAMIILFYARARWWRLFSFLFIQFGTMQIYSASRYFCSQVHGRTSRQLYPWELTSMIEGEENVESNTAPTFAVALKPGQTAKLDSSLADSMPFLSEKPQSSIPSITTATKPKGRFFGAWRKDDGGRVPIFGPERAVEDEYIKYAHNQQIKEILIIGLVVMLIFEAGILGIPEIGGNR